LIQHLPHEDAAEDSDSRDSSLRRALDVIGLISLQTPLIRIDDVMARFGYSRSTAYRYVRELCAAGLLVQRVGGRYALGPRILEFERLLELTDPLYRAGRLVMPAIRRDDSVLLLQELYGEEQVMCLYKVGPDELEHQGQRLSLRRARGLPLPLFQGAASLSLLAWLSPYQIRRTYLASADRIAEAGLASNWRAFQKSLTAIRRRGYVVSRSPVTPVLVGIGVPIFAREEERLVGSLARIMAAPELDAATERANAEELLQAAARIAREYNAFLSAREMQ
jgi:DNA-binding IclR family transcriptional regulator